VIKRLTSWQVKQGVTAEEAVHHWLTHHVPLVLAVPGVQRYIQNRCIPGPTGEDPPYTGLGELWFDSEEIAGAALASLEWKAVLDDAGTFMDMDRIVAAWAEEHPAV
jgi:uncharacterized protein (TIGR02118 family)